MRIDPLGHQPVLQQERVEGREVLDQVEKPQVAAHRVAVGAGVEARRVEQRLQTVSAAELEARAAVGDPVGVVRDIDHGRDVAALDPDLGIEGNGPELTVLEDLGRRHQRRRRRPRDFLRALDEHYPVQCPVAKQQVFRRRSAGRSGLFFQPAGDCRRVQDATGAGTQSLA
jgi:hypothetical protein